MVLEGFLQAEMISAKTILQSMQEERRIVTNLALALKVEAVT